MSAISPPYPSSPVLVGGAQNLSPAQQAQGRANLGALSKLGSPRAGADMASSAALARLAYEDSAATVENWADTSAWALGANPSQVSGNRLYASATPGAGSGLNRSLSLGVGEVLRCVTEVNYVAGGRSGGLMFGVSTATAGSAPAGSGGGCYALYIRHGAQVQSVSNGTIANIADATNPTTGTWVLTLTVDANWIAVVARKSDGTYEYRYRWARSGVSINNVFLFNSDANALTGSSFGRIGWRKSFASIAPRTGIEGVGTTVHWGGNGTDSWCVRVPAAYDSRRPLPIVVMWHGNGSDENHWAPAPSPGNANGSVVANAFLAAGYIVLGVTTTSNSTWGAQASLNAYFNAYKWVRDNFAIGPVVFYGNSMGGIESLLGLAERRIPGVVAWIGTSPTYSLLSNYNFNFGATIRTAYGMAGDGSDYAEKSAGHDPALMGGDAFLQTPMYWVYATDDAAVNMAENGAALVPVVTPYAIEAVAIATTGGHSFSFSPYTAAMTAFADKHAGR